MVAFVQSKASTMIFLYLHNLSLDISAHLKQYPNFLSHHHPYSVVLKCPKGNTGKDPDDLEAYCKS